MSLPANGKGDRPWRFKPGQSGNPKGKPPGPSKDIKELCQAMTPLALAALEACLKSKGERATAANILLAYGWGKPAQSVELTGKDRGPIRFEDVSEDTRASIDSMLAEFVAARDAESETKH